MRPFWDTNWATWDAERAWRKQDKFQNERCDQKQTVDEKMKSSWRDAAMADTPLLEPTKRFCDDVIGVMVCTAWLACTPVDSFSTHLTVCKSHADH